MKFLKSLLVCATILIASIATVHSGSMTLLGAGSSSSSTFGFSNFTGSNLPNWVTARAAVVGGSSNAKVLDFGNSTVAGYGSVASSTQPSGIFATRMADLSTTLGVTASISSFFSDHNLATATSGLVTLGVFDPRIVEGSWAPNSDFGFGGGTLLSSASTPLTFTPVNSVDTFDIYYTTFTGFGSFSYQIDSGSVTTLSQNVASSVTKVSATATLGAHTVKIAQVSGAVGLTGVIAYNSAIKEVSLINSGYAGATSAMLTDPDSGFPWSNTNMIAKVAPNLTIIEGGVINDWDTGVAVATSMAHVQIMITAALQSGAGDVILISPNPSEASVGSMVPYATQQTYVDAMKALAVTNGIPFIDVWRLFGGTWEAAQANGYNYDNTHPSGAGYAQIASYIATGLAPGFRSP